MQTSMMSMSAYTTATATETAVSSRMQKNTNPTGKGNIGFCGTAFAVPFFVRFYRVFTILTAILRFYANPVMQCR